MVLVLALLARGIRDRLELAITRRHQVVIILQMIKATIIKHDVVSFILIIFNQHLIVLHFVLDGSTEHARVEFFVQVLVLLQGVFFMLACGQGHVHFEHLF